MYSYSIAQARAHRHNKTESARGWQLLKTVYGARLRLHCDVELSPSLDWHVIYVVLHSPPSGDWRTRIAMNVRRMRREARACQ